MKYCILNGALTRTDQAFVSIRDRGFRYGDGVFETLAVQGGVPYQFEWHMQRLTKGLAQIRISFDTGRLQAECRRLLQANGLTDGILRLQITRGSGRSGYLPDPHSPPFCVIETMPPPLPPVSPVSLWQSGYVRISANALPVSAKLCQGLNATLARMEASDHGCFEALMLNERGQLCETSSANLFWLAGGRLHTPPLSCGVLEGSTRAALLRLSPYPVHETDALPETLKEAEAVFITNVSWLALPVHALLPIGFAWESRECAQSMQDVLAQDRIAYANAHASQWR